MADKHPLWVPRALDAEESVVVVHAPELLLPTHLEVVGLVEVGPGPGGVQAELVQGLVRVRGTIAERKVNILLVIRLIEQNHF